MSTDSHVRHLVAAAAPLWAGEAEVARSYFNSPTRSVASDMQWIGRQCFKEFWGTGASKYDLGGIFFGTLKNLLEAAPKLDITVDREEILAVVETFHAEYSHYCAFARVYDAIRPAGTARMNPHDLEHWAEDARLTELRLGHRDQHGDIGQRATRFTEGGYCTLFSEGMKLKGRSPTDDKIAAACELVYEDEFEHMLLGVSGIAEVGMKPADWALMEELVTAQLRHRVLMRNAQFGFPLSKARVESIFRGEIEPIRFDYAKARLAA